MVMTKKTKWTLIVLGVLITVPLLAVAVIICVFIFFIIFQSESHSVLTRKAGSEAAIDSVKIEAKLEKHYRDTGYYPSKDIYRTLFDKDTLVNTKLSREYSYKVYATKERDVNGKYFGQPSDFQGPGCRYELTLYPDSFLGESGGEAIVDISNDQCATTDLTTDTVDRGVTRDYYIPLSN